MRCCDLDGCNTGAFTDDFSIRPTSSVASGGGSAVNLPGAPLLAGAVSSAPGFPSGAVPTPPSFGGGGGGGVNQFQQQQQIQQLLAQVAAGGNPEFPAQPGLSPSNFLANPAGAQQFLTTRQQQQQQQQQFNPAITAFFNQNQQPGTNILGTVGANPALQGFSSNPFGSNVNNGNCQRYFPKRGDGEWLPNTLMPLSYDRASETKVCILMMFL